MKIHLKSLFCAGALLVTGSAFAWIDTGHMVIAQLAYRKLTPKVAKECDELLKIGASEKADSFITAACWADDTRDQKSGVWHYINFHFRKDGKNTENEPEGENIVVAIKRFSEVLKDRTKPAAERADALRYLIHFVGDIHQPLHSVAMDSDEFPKGDRGGNDFKIRTGEAFAKMERPPTNLHFLWDIGGGLFKSEQRPLAPDAFGRITIQAYQLEREWPEKKNVTNIQDPEKWAQESFAVAKNIAYNLEPETEVSDGYLRAAKIISAQRASTAGYRLAKLLNSLLDKPSK